MKFLWLVRPMHGMDQNPALGISSRNQFTFELNGSSLKKVKIVVKFRWMIFLDKPHRVETNCIYIHQALCTNICFKIGTTTRDGVWEKNVPKNGGVQNPIWVPWLWVRPLPPPPLDHSNCNRDTLAAAHEKTKGFSNQEWWICGSDNQDDTHGTLMKQCDEIKGWCVDWIEECFGLQDIAWVWLDGMMSCCEGCDWWACIHSDLWMSCSPLLAPTRNVKTQHLNSVRNMYWNPMKV